MGEKAKKEKYNSLYMDVRRSNVYVKCLFVFALLWKSLSDVVVLFWLAIICDFSVYLIRIIVVCLMSFGYLIFVNIFPLIYCMLFIDCLRSNQFARCQK